MKRQTTLATEGFFVLHNGFITLGFDIEPTEEDIKKLAALEFEKIELPGSDSFTINRVHKDFCASVIRDVTDAADLRQTRAQIEATLQAYLKHEERGAEKTFTDRSDQ